MFEGPNVCAPGDTPEVLLSAQEREDIAVFKKLSAILDAALTEAQGIQDRKRNRDALDAIKEASDFFASEIEDIIEGGCVDFAE